MQGFTDYLTGLPNRYGFEAHYEKLKPEGKAHVVFVDLLNFKRINELFCYSAGDWVLKEFGRVLAEEWSGHYVSRIGSDEFIVIIDAKHGRSDIMAKVNSMIKKTESLAGKRELVNLIKLCVGVLYDVDVSLGTDELLDKCDVAAYHSKMDDEVTHCVYEYKGNEIGSAKSIEAELKEAFQNHDIKVYLQPKVNMIAKKMIGSEALARWVHPVYGLRTPDQFIPLLEKNGMIVDLDLYIFEEVCKLKQFIRDKDYGHLPISVNISRLHLFNPTFPDRLDAITRKYGVDNSEIELEVTENIYINDKTELLKSTKMLSGRGFSISLDDFGSGYSALNMLKDIPADVIKLDRGFLLMADDDVRGKMVLKNIIYMCKDLRYEVIMEGIETEEQIEYVIHCGCENAQGYYFARPLPVPDFIRFCEDAFSVGEEVIEFGFRGTLESEDGKYVAEYIPGESGAIFSYEQGVNERAGAIRLPGGEVRKNILSVSSEVFVSENYTVALWVKPDKLESWTSVLYVNYETGFMHLSPLGLEDQFTYRVRNMKLLDAYHDTMTESTFAIGVWTHIAISYSSKYEIAKLYVNGKLMQTEEGVKSMLYPRIVYFGGDIYKPPFAGCLSEIKIYKEVKEDAFIKKLYNSYFG